MNIGLIFLIVLIAGAAGALLVLMLQKGDTHLRVKGQDIGTVLREHEELREKVEDAVVETVESLSDKQLAERFKEMYDEWKTHKSDKGRA